MNLGLKTDGKKHTLQIPRAWTELALRVRQQCCCVVFSCCRLRENAHPATAALIPTAVPPGARTQQGRKEPLLALLYVVRQANAPSGASPLPPDLTGSFGAVALCRFMLPFTLLPHHDPN